MSYRSSLQFFLRHHDHLQQFVAEPNQYAVVETNRARANTRRNDLSIALKAYAKEKWSSEHIHFSADAAYRVDAMYVFIVRPSGGNYYICLKSRGTVDKTGSSIGVRVGMENTHDARKLDVFEAVCLCLQHEVIIDPVCFFGTPTPWHHSIAQTRGLEIFHEPDEPTFRVC